MKLIVLNSNSSGNGYVLASSSGSLLLEAGCYTRHVNPFIKAVHPVFGCVVSHHHTDHAKYAKHIAQRCMLRGTEDTVDGIQGALPMKEGKTYAFGDFHVAPFTVQHYNADESVCENFGYLIRHPEMGTLLFATDTFTLPYRFQNVNHFLIECNYQDEILNEQVEKGETSFSQKKRIQLSHMSLQGCIAAIRQCGTGRCRSITLCHISSRHADSEVMVRTVQSEFGVPVYIAKKRAEIPLI